MAGKPVVKSITKKIRFLINKGYQINHTSVGWWVDGACGFKVAGYYNTRKEAVLKAHQEIQHAAKQPDNFPIWFFVN